MKLLELLTQAEYEYRKSDNEFRSPITGRWLKGGEALKEFYRAHFPDQTPVVAPDEDPFASVQIRDKGNKIELTRLTPQRGDSLI